jgi:hypothetical protein
VAVEIPVADKTLGQLLVVLLNFRNGGTQRAQVGRRTGWLAVLIENQPVRMLFNHIRQLIRAVVENVFSVSILGNDGNPPQRDPDTRIVISLDDLLE